MPAVEALNETLVFEIPSRTWAESLCERLRPRWHADFYDCGEVVLVAATLRARADDLDGRSYVLDSGLGLLGQAAA